MNIFARSFQGTVSTRQLLEFNIGDQISETEVEEQNETIETSVPPTPQEDVLNIREIDPEVIKGFFNTQAPPSESIPTLPDDPAPVPPPPSDSSAGPLPGGGAPPSDIDPNDPGPILGGGPTPPPTSPPSENENKANLMYEGLLGRAADPEGKANLVQYLDNGGSLEDAFLNMISSDEYITKTGGSLDSEERNHALVESLYHKILNREPDPQGLQDHWNALNSGSITFRDLAQTFLNSSEFQNKYGDVDTLLNYMEQLPDGPGGSGSSGGSGGTGDPGGPGDPVPPPVDDSIPQPPAANNEERAQRMYGGLLQRAADPSGLNNLVTFLDNGGSLEDAFLNMISSDEYITKTGGSLDSEERNHALVESLYHKILNREPDPQGLQNHWNALNSGSITFRDLAQTFLNSSEFQNNYGDVDTLLNYMVPHPYSLP